MMDWMLQVFRALNVSTAQTFFLAASILDRYFQEKTYCNKPVGLEQLHILGLVSMHLSSKLEDIYPIRMTQIVRDAGHNKYQVSDILNTEQDIIETLQYKLQNQSVYEEASILLKNCELDYKRDKLLSGD